MENASKALIIAGAILLSILIIAIGMYIYNSSQNSIYQAADQISTQERDAFNSQWTTYEGQQPGSNVKALIGKLISNAKTNEEEATKLVQIRYKATSGSNFEDVTSAVGNINITGFNTARTAIESRHTYTVELRYSENTSLIDGILIKYDKADTDTVENIPAQQLEGGGN